MKRVRWKRIDRIDKTERGKMDNKMDSDREERRKGQELDRLLFTAASDLQRAAPVGLAERIVGQLHRRHHRKESLPRRRDWGLWLTAALLVASFFLGIFFDRVGLLPAIEEQLSLQSSFLPAGSASLVPYAILMELEEK